MSYKYRTFIQASKPYEYGEGQKLKNKEEAKKEVERVKNNILKTLAINKIYELSKVIIVEEENFLQIVVEIKVPIVVEE